MNPKPNYFIGVGEGGEQRVHRCAECYGFPTAQEAISSKIEKTKILLRQAQEVVDYETDLINRLKLLWEQEK